MSESTSANDNTAMGYAALVDQTTATGNTAFGNYAGENITTGYSNACIGRSSGDVITTGYGNTLLGYGTNVSANNAEFQIVLGNGVLSHGDNKLTFGQGTGSNRVYNSYTVNASWTRVSDERYKENITPNTDCGL